MRILTSKLIEWNFGSADDEDREGLNVQTFEAEEGGSRNIVNGTF